MIFLENILREKTHTLLSTKLKTLYPTSHRRKQKMRTVYNTQFGHKRYKEWLRLLINEDVSYLIETSLFSHAKPRHFFPCKMDTCIMISFLPHRSVFLFH